MLRFGSGFIGVLAIVGLSTPAGATAVFSGSSVGNNGLSASASFTISGDPGSRFLTILLTNTDATAPTAPSEVLSGLFFNLGTSAFAPVSASTYDQTNGVYQPGSIIQDAQCNSGAATCDGVTDIGSEWSYALGGASWLSGTNQGIGSAGYLNANTSNGNFGPGNLDGPDGLNGIEFGLVPDGWTEYSGNGGLDGNALVEGAVRFVLSIPDGLEEGQIKDVYFTYGTSSTGPSFQGQTSTTTTSGSTGRSVPEPATMSLVGLALAGISYRLRRLAGARPRL